MIIKLPFLPWDLKVRRCARNEADYPHQTAIKRGNFNKIFCIGQNKTGTTSLEGLLSLAGLKLGNQRVGEVLGQDWLINRNAERIIRFCHTADAFQDAPFSFPDLHAELDKAFPGSKFILTVRSSPEEWFRSLSRFHTKLFSSDPSRPPNRDDLSKATYRYQGYVFDVISRLYGYPETPLYDEGAYKNYYLRDNAAKRAYFETRPGDFLEINLAVKGDFQRLCDFLGIETDIKGFPWLNKTG